MFHALWITQNNYY